MSNTDQLVNDVAENCLSEAQACLNIFRTGSIIGLYNLYSIVKKYLDQKDPSSVDRDLIYNCLLKLLNEMELTQTDYNNFIFIINKQPFNNELHPLQSICDVLKQLMEDNKVSIEINPMPTAFLLRFDYDQRQLIEIASIITSLSPWRDTLKNQLRFRLYLTPQIGLNTIEKNPQTYSLILTDDGFYYQEIDNAIPQLITDDKQLLQELHEFFPSEYQFILEDQYIPDEKRKANCIYFNLSDEINSITYTIKLNKNPDSVIKRSIALSYFKLDKEPQPIDLSNPETQKTVKEKLKKALENKGQISSLALSHPLTEPQLKKIMELASFDTNAIPSFQQIQDTISILGDYLYRFELLHVGPDDLNKLLSLNEKNPVSFGAMNLSINRLKNSNEQYIRASNLVKNTDKLTDLYQTLIDYKELLKLQINSAPNPEHSRYKRKLTIRFETIEAACKLLENEEGTLDINTDPINMLLIMDAIQICKNNQPCKKEGSLLQRLTLILYQILPIQCSSFFNIGKEINHIQTLDRHFKLGS